MKWKRGYPHHQIYHILEKQRRQIEEIEKKRKEEEKKAWKAAREKFRDVVSAEKRYKKDLEAEIYEITIWDVLKMHGVRPLFKDLWELAKACADSRGCYRMLVHFKLAGREGDLQLVREAERLGADVEIVITLLYAGKREEAVKLLRQ
jgi:hypothetical protein